MTSQEGLWKSEMALHISSLYLMLPGPIHLLRLPFVPLGALALGYRMDTVNSVTLVLVSHGSVKVGEGELEFSVAR